MGINLKQSTETSTATSAPSSALEFRAPRKALHKLLRQLQGVSDPRSTLPVLANVAIRGTVKEGVTFATTDLNTTLTIRTPAWFVSSPGGVMVNAKALTTLMGKLPGDDVSIKVMARGGTPVVVVTAGSVSSTLDGLPDRDFPKLPEAGEAHFSKLPAALFSGMFERALFSVCKDETRFHLNGVLFECSGTLARTVSTDGHRLTKIECPVEAGPVLVNGALVPSKGATQIGKLLGSRARGECEIAVSQMRMFVRYMGAELAIKLIDAQFPPYLQVIPADNRNLVSVDRKGLIGAMERAALLCSETRGVKVTFGGGGMTLTSDAPGSGVSVESMPAGGIGAERTEPTSIGLNTEYMIEALEGIEDEHVTLAFGDELDPVLVRGTEHACSYAPQVAPFLCVVMPMRI